MARLAACLSPNGILLLGASDNLPHGATELLEPVPASETAALTPGEWDWFERPERRVKAWRRKASADFSPLRPAPCSTFQAHKPLHSAGLGMGSGGVGDSCDANSEERRRNKQAREILRTTSSLQSFRRSLGLVKSSAGKWRAPRQPSAA